MENHIVKDLSHGKGNPRNSEGAFATLADGRLLFAWSRYTGDSWADEARAEIAAIESNDGGRTWSSRPRVLVTGEGRRNVMSVSLERLSDGKLGLFYLRKNGLLDCRLRLRVSGDEGKTWGKPILATPTPGYFVVNNDRVVQLSSGRLIAPAGYHRLRAKLVNDPDRLYDSLDFRSIAVFFLSDDGGWTWREGQDWWAFPGQTPSGLQEPGVVELKEGRLWAWCRTEAGFQYELFSEDGGDTWTAPLPSRFAAPCSPMSVKRIPSTGDLLAVWNDLSYPMDRQPSSWQRTPLAAAISQDDGRTWGQAKLLEDDPERGFCYTALHFVEEAVLLAYCCGGRDSAVLQDACIRRIGLDWLYS